MCLVPTDNRRHARSAFLTLVSSLLLFGFLLVLAEKSYRYTAWEFICSESFHDDGRLQTL